MTTPTNNKKNVSTTRGIDGAYLYSAPIGTPGAPTASTFKTWASDIPAGWDNEGYIDQEGFTETVDIDSGDTIRDINLDPLDQADGPATESNTFKLLDMAKNSLGTQLGHENVTDSNGTLEAKHNWGNAGEHRQYVFLLLLKNGRIWVKYVPDGKLTALGDFTGNRSTAAGRDVTITYNADDDGNTCYDWIESNDTPAPQLSALSGTNLTLSPSFSAGTLNYTATASSTSTTITATAASGNTVSIKDGNGNTYSSGGSVPLVTGTNKIMVIVTNTDTGAKGIYTITATKS